MNKPIKLKIDVTKLDKSLFFKSQKTGAVYCDLAAWPNDQPSDYGDTHRVYQDKPRDSDRKMPIVGNLTLPELAPPVGPPPARDGNNYDDSEEQDDDIPF